MNTDLASRVQRHLRSNAVAYVALFFAMSGTAAALSGSNTVLSDDVVDNSLTGADVNEATLKGVAGTCPAPATVRLGRICAGSDGVSRRWENAWNYCASLGLELPSLSQANVLAKRYNVPRTT